MRLVILHVPVRLARHIISLVVSVPNVQSLPAFNDGVRRLFPLSYVIGSFRRDGVCRFRSMLVPQVNCGGTPTCGRDDVGMGRLGRPVKLESVP